MSAYSSQLGGVDVDAAWRGGVLDEVGVSTGPGEGVSHGVATSWRLDPSLREIMGN